MASNIEQIKIEAKKNLSSLIISSAKGLTVKRLRTDYYEMIGTDMPFKQLGFRNVEEYLLSMPDVCMLEGYGDFAVVVPVVSEKNKHINEMILKQKSTKPVGRYQIPKRRRGIYNIQNLPPVQRPPPKPVETFKFPSIPDSQRKTLPPPPDVFYDRMKSNPRAFNQTSRNMNQNKENLMNFPQNPNYPQLPQTSNNHLSAQRVVPLCNNPQNQINRNITPPLLPPGSNNDFGTLSDSSDQIISGKVPDVQKGVELLNIYRRVESQEEDEFDDDDEFFEELNFNVDDDDFNYVSDNEVDVTTSMRNLVVRNEIPNPIPGPTSEPPVVEEPHISRVNKKVQDKLKILISEHPDGIWCSKLLRLYEEKFRTRLDPLNFGFGSVIEMCDDLPDIFHCVRPNRTDWKIYDKTKPIPDHTMIDFCDYLSSLPVVRDERNTEPPLPANIMYPIPTYSYPEEVLHPGETIKRQWLTNNEKLGDYIELVISEVYDPSKFWIQLKATTDDLGKLMDEMQLFYTHSANSYLLNEFNVRVGLVCAAVFMNEYHRAVVLKTFDDHTIKVFYCDYGTVSQVSLQKTCFLHRDFAELPMQAIRARLANIIPKEKNTMWPRAASNLMLSLIMEKDLVGYINSIDYEQEILDLIVTDTSKPTVDIHINDVLVEEGFAVLGNEAPLSNESNAVVPNVHLYPAFEELENAIYPCVSDVITMLKLGHTYETIFHGYFATSASSSQLHDYSNLQHSRCSTSFDEAYSNSVCIENSVISEHIDEVFTETQPETHENQEEDIAENQEYNPESNAEYVTENQKNIEQEIPVPESDKADSYTTENTTESHQIRAPPGFENHQPVTYSEPQPLYYNTKPVYPGQGIPLTQNPLPFQNYPMLNTYPYTLLTNPLLYNQIMMNQQNAEYLRTMQQVTLIEEMQKLQQMNQAVNSLAQSRIAQADSQPQVPYCDNYVRSDKIQVLSDTSENSASNSRTDSTNFNTDQISNLESISKNFQITTDFRNDASSSICSSEHICERFVLKLTVQEYTIHIIKIENEYYVVFQEVIANLLKNNLPWKKWIKSVSITGNTIPNILVNIMNYKHLYNQIKRFNIPGINASNNLGCIVRLILLTNVLDIVAKFGDKNILPNLKAGIAHVMENTDLWKDVDSFD